MEADQLNQLRPQDAPKIVAETILNRRTAFKRERKTSGALARTALPDVVPLVFAFRAQIIIFADALSGAAEKTFVALLKAASESPA